MDLIRINSDKITISFAPDELSFLSNAINEVLEAVEDWEFHTRTGETRSRAEEIKRNLERYWMSPTGMQAFRVSSRTPAAGPSFSRWRKGAE